MNQNFNEELFNSARYVDNYLKTVKHMPDEVQRHLSHMRELSVEYRRLLLDADLHYDFVRSLQNSTAGDVFLRRSRAIARMEQCLIQAQQLSDEKMETVYFVRELVENKAPEQDSDPQNVDINKVPQEMQCGEQQSNYDWGTTQTKEDRTESPMRENNQLSSHDSSIGPEVRGNVDSIVYSEQLVLASNSNTDVNDDANNTSVSNSGYQAFTNGDYYECNPMIRSCRRRNASQKNTNVQQQYNVDGRIAASGGASNTRKRRSAKNSKKKKIQRKRTNQASSAQASNTPEVTQPANPVNPAEPIYCLCNQISFGEMICCDNNMCPMQWFHFPCVGIIITPKGKWFCPICRGTKASTKKPKANLLKELQYFKMERE